jgi:hypothetical protein
MWKMVSSLNKAITKAGGGVNNDIIAKALVSLGWHVREPHAWQPIETAPTDNTSVLVYGFWEGELYAKEDQREIWKAHFDHNKWWVDGGEYYSQSVISPTHWMPLPKPPER